MHSFNQEESLHKAMATDFTLPFAYNIINLHITDITIKAFLLQPQKWCEVLQSGYVCLSLCSHSSKSTCPNFMNFLYVTRGHGSVLLWWQCNMLCTSGFVDDITFLHNRAHMMSAPPLHPPCCLPLTDIHGTHHYTMEFGCWGEQCITHTGQVCYPWLPR